MVLTRARRLALCAATGVLYPLSFPDFDLGFLAWILLVPLHIAMVDAPPRQAFRYGWLAGLVAFVGTMSWVVTAMHLYGKMPLIPSYLLMLLLAAYLGLFVAAYALCVAMFQRKLPSLMLLGAPCVWVALELLRTHLLSGLPWSLLGYSQYRWVPAIQIADHTGVYGISFLIVLVNVAVSETGLWVVRYIRGSRAHPFPWRPPAAAVLGMTMALTYGYYQLAQADAGRKDTEATRFVKIGLVQANIDQARKWDQAYRMETLRRYGRLTAEASVGADLVLWPEAATPFIYERELDYREAIAMLVRSLNVPLLLGSPAVRYHPDGSPYLLNSAYMLTRSGEISGRYDKQHLVPFGEYVPLRDSVLFFLDKLVVGIGDFEEGPGPTMLEMTPSSSPHPVKFGVVICYEVIFPDLVRRFAAQDAAFMVTITNDAWFGDSAAPFQHFGMVVLRSVENRVAFARAANTGVSGLIDPWGRILIETPIFQELVAQGEIPLMRVTTFYAQYGDVFAYSCVIIAGILLLRTSWRRRLEAKGSRQAVEKRTGET